MPKSTKVHPTSLLMRYSGTFTFRVRMRPSSCGKAVRILRRLFTKYDAVDGSDLVAFNTTFRFGENKTAWNHWRACVYCRYVDPWRRQASLLPAFRISKRLSLELFTFLNSSSRSGHHEAMLPTFVTARDTSFTWTDLAPDVGYVRWRPVFDADNARASAIREDALYHPVKSPRARERLSRAFSRPSNASLATV